MASSATTGTRIAVSPPRWQPSPLRWHTTQVGLVQAWRYALGAVVATARHTIYDYAHTLPGCDDVVSARIPLVRVLIVRDPEYARHVLVTNQDNYGKSAEYDLLAVAFGRGLVTDLDDESWRSRRTLVQPVFGKRHVDGFATQMTDAVARTAERWQRTSREGRPLDVAAEMNAVTLDIIGSTMFGTDLTGPDAERMREAFARMLRLFGDGVMSGGAYHARRIANVLWRLGPRRHEPQDPMLVVRVLRAFTRVTEPRTYKGLRWLMRFIQDMVAEYRADPEQREDNLLALLVDATDPDTGRGLTDAQVRDELMTFLGAGHETTASGLAWTWLLLSRHPDVRARLQDELDTVLGGRTPTVEDLEALPWTRAVVEESMRLYPPIMGVGRVARGDDQLGTIPIRQGETIVVLIHGIHHNPDVWPDPERFDPERFMPGRPGPGSRLATMPFGAGRRGCIAATFARMEATLIMAMLSQRFELDLREQPPIRRQNTFTGGPEGAVWMDVRERV